MKIQVTLFLILFFFISSNGFSYSNTIEPPVHEKKFELVLHGGLGFNTTRLFNLHGDVDHLEYSAGIANGGRYIGGKFQINFSSRFSVNLGYTYHSMDNSFQFIHHNQLHVSGSV